MTTRIAFGTNPRFLSRLIRWVTRSEWSHVWLEYDSDDWLSRWAVHAGPDGVVAVPVENVRRAYPRARVYELEGADLDAGRRVLERYVGAAYDYRSVIWNGVLLLLSRVFAKELLEGAVNRDAAKMSCSEFGTLALIEAGVPEVAELEAELTPPGRLEELVAEVEGARVVEELGAQ